MPYAASIGRTTYIGIACRLPQVRSTVCVCVYVVKRVRVGTIIEAPAASRFALPFKAAANVGMVSCVSRSCDAMQIVEDSESTYMSVRVRSAVNTDMTYSAR